MVAYSLSVVYFYIKLQVESSIWAGGFLCSFMASALTSFMADINAAHHLNHGKLLPPGTLRINLALELSRNRSKLRFAIAIKGRQTPKTRPQECS